MTEIRTNVPGIDTMRQTTGADARVGQSTGSFKTAKAEIIDMNSLISNAAEELVSAFSEETEKDVSERDVEDGKKADSLKRLMQTPELQEILKSRGYERTRFASRPQGIA